MQRERTPADQPAPAGPPAAPASGQPAAAQAPAAPTSDTAGHEATLADAASDLDAVEAALARLDEGTFDTCEVCGAPIGRDRLLQDPLLTRCPQHSGAPPPGG